jgi:hypothetical protein
MSTKKINADLDRLIKRASEVKTAGLKQAASISAKLDSADDGTSSLTTGEQASKNKAESADLSATSPDGGAKANAVGKSVENSTENATAAAVSGNEGAKGAELSIKGEADNGEEKAQNKVAALRAQAEALHKAAAALLTPFDHYLVKAARASEDKQVKTAAEAMPEDDLADAASDQLMEQLATGQIDDAAAAQILEEALQAGALTPEEVQQASALAEQASAGAASEAPVEAGAEAPVEAPVAEEAPVDGEMAAKLAAAEVGPEHPEYIAKLDALHKADQDAGAAYFAKVAAFLIKQAEGEEEEKEEKEETPAEEKKEEKAEAKEEAPAAPAAEGAPAPATEEAPAVIDAMAGANLAPASPEEQQALEAIKAELGLTDEQLAQLQAQPMPQMDKVAAAKAAYRAAIMSKVAALKK